MRTHISFLHAVFDWSQISKVFVEYISWSAVLISIASFHRPRKYSQWPTSRNAIKIDFQVYNDKKCWQLLFMMRTQVKSKNLRLHAPVNFFNGTHFRVDKVRRNLSARNLLRIRYTGLSGICHISSVSFTHPPLFSGRNGSKVKQVSSKTDADSSGSCYRIFVLG